MAMLKSWHEKNNEIATNINYSYVIDVIHILIKRSHTICCRCLVAGVADALICWLLLL